MQHKKEAYFFYSFLSIFYDKVVNPLFWTKRMRDNALELAEFEDHMKVIDVGSGTGFTTEGIVRFVPATQVTCVDQSPHQMAKAKAKESLQRCQFRLGDAENIPFENDHFDRYVSAGSIEYWPNPQQGINESYRVIKPGGRALMIGPLEPPDFLSRYIANTWMLFPKDEEYRGWYANAGFTNIQVKYISPHWIKKEKKYGIAIIGTKERAGSVAADIIDPKIEEEQWSIARYVLLIWRVLIGSLAGFLFIPIALFGYLRSATTSQKHIAPEYRERLNIYQWIAILSFVAILVLIINWLF